MLEDSVAIKELGIENLNEEQQQNVLDEYKMQIGEALAKNLNEEQLAEFESIINGDQSVIDSWLVSNRPDYRNDSRYIEIVEATSVDNPENVTPDKVYATTAWLEVANPGFADVVESVKQNIKSKINDFIG
jgi:hypothetical protein